MILNKIKSSILFKNTFIYTLLMFINSGIPFLLLPILTRYLTPEDYGIIANYNTFVGILSVFIGLSLSGAVGVSFFHLDKKELKLYIGNVFNILLLSLFLAVIIIFLLKLFIEENLKLPAFWLFIAATASCMHMITNINLTLWRSQQKAKPFAFYEISQTLFNVLLTISFIIILKYGWEGRLSAIAISTIIFGFLSIVFIFKRGYAKLNISKKYMIDAIKFGVTLIPHQLALWMRSGVDIWLITSLVGLSATGLYNVSFQFGMVVGIFASAFNNAFSPYLYEKLSKNNLYDKRQIVKFTYIYFIGIILFAMLLSTFFTWLIPYFLGEKFYGASAYIYWISLAYAFQGMYLMVVNYIFYAKKNHLISMVTISTSLLHLFLSFMLIKQYGAIGAAYASVFSFSLTFLLVWKISSQVVKMPWNI